MLGACDEHRKIPFPTLLQVREASAVSGRRRAPHFVARINKSTTSKAVNDFLAVVRKV